MKKTSIILGMLAMSLSASSQRLVLFEEFTGENCGPCAGTNPTIDALMAQASNTVKIQAIKWQVAIPSAPTATWSLYQTYSADPNTRRTYYSCNSAPFGYMDGLGLQGWGAASNNAAYLTQARINTANAVSTPFVLGMNATWDGTFSNAVVTITVSTPTTGFTANGALKLRVVMVEKQVNFATPPGSNGETQFNFPVRKAYPDITNGTGARSPCPELDCRRPVKACHPKDACGTRNFCAPSDSTIRYTIKAGEEEKARRWWLLSGRATSSR
jgi:hypothetical protein